LGLLSPKRKILGMDLDGFKMKHADKGIPNVEFRLADITKTNIPPADCILLIHVLHHLASSEDQEPLVRACLDRIKSGGKLLIAGFPFPKSWLSAFNRQQNAATIFGRLLPNLMRDIEQ